MVIEIGLGRRWLQRLLAWWAHPELVLRRFLLTGVANVAIWTVAMSLLLTFEASPSARSISAGQYTGGASLYLAPFLGGWLADLAAIRQRSWLGCQRAVHAGCITGW